MRLTLKASLLAAFGLLTLLSVGQGLLSITTLAGIRADVTGVAENRLPSVVAITSIRGAASEVRIKQLRTLALSGSPESRVENKEQIDKAIYALSVARKAYEQRIASAEERALY